MGKRARDRVEIRPVARQAGQADDRQATFGRLAIAAHVQPQPIGRRHEPAFETRVVCELKVCDRAVGHAPVSPRREEA